MLLLLFSGIIQILSISVGPLEGRTHMATERRAPLPIQRSAGRMPLLLYRRAVRVPCTHIRKDRRGRMGRTAVPKKYVYGTGPVPGPYL